jgi:hypothetical protein
MPANPDLRASHSRIHRIAVEEFLRLMEQFGIETLTPEAGQEHFDFILKDHEDRRTPVDIACFEDTLRLSLDQNKYPLVAQWALAVVWVTAQGPEFYFIPCWAWLKPGNAIRISRNARSRRGPTWNLHVDSRTVTELEPYRIPAPSRQWLPPRANPDQIAMMVTSARPDLPQHPRGLQKPHFYPPAALSGESLTRGIRVRSPLYEAFKEFLKNDEGDMSMNVAIEDYMAWVLGIDCPNSPHFDKLPPQVKTELDQELARGRRLPSYYVDEFGFPR